MTIFIESDSVAKFNELEVNEESACAPLNPVPVFLTKEPTTPLTEKKKLTLALTQLQF